VNISLLLDKQWLGSESPSFYALTFHCLKRLCVRRRRKIPQRWMRALALSIASHLAAQHRCQHIRRSKSSRLDFPLPLSPVSTRCKNAGELHFKNMINSILRRKFFTFCQRF
jgi:hypothetical protein